MSYETNGITIYMSTMLTKYIILLKVRCVWVTLEAPVCFCRLI